ncbi:MAG: lipocalin-like domain-containing protein [Thermodesulfobacteriota bacterium]
MSSKLIGTWKLIDFIGKDQDSNTVLPFGKKPQGYITFTENKFMFTTITTSDRALFETKDRLNAAKDQKAEAFDSHISYCSKYELVENKILLNVLAASVPNWVGSFQERFFRFENEKLILETAPREVDGKKLTMKVSWERAE